MQTVKALPAHEVQFFQCRSLQAFIRQKKFLRAFSPDNYIGKGGGREDEGRGSGREGGEEREGEGKERGG
jgi:hypothetical protein